MPNYSLILTLCLLIATGSLGLGYVRAGYWLILPIFLLLALLWRFSKGQPVFWRAASLLIVYVGLAGIGIVIDLPLELMLVAVSFALVSWDLIQFNQDITTGIIRKPATALEKQHSQSLALATLGGLLLAVLGSSIELRFPFGVTVLLVLIAIGGLVIGRQYLLERKS